MRSFTIQEVAARYGVPVQVLVELQKQGLASPDLADNRYSEFRLQQFATNNQFTIAVRRLKTQYAQHQAQKQQEAIDDSADLVGQLHEANAECDRWARKAEQLENLLAARNRKRKQTVNEG